GLVGNDGATHHGIFDIAYLKCIPNLKIFAASDLISLRQILYTAQYHTEGPIAIRYPRGRGFIKKWKVPFKPIEIGKGIQIKSGTRTALLCIGTTLQHALRAIKIYEKSIEIGCYDLRFIKPLDEALLHIIFKKYTHIISIEDGVIEGGVGQSIIAFANQNNYSQKVYTIGISDIFPTHGNTSQLEMMVGIPYENILQLIKKLNSTSPCNLLKSCTTFPSDNLAIKSQANIKN